MSFFNSVLSSVQNGTNSDTQSVPAPKPRPQEAVLHPVVAAEPSKPKPISVTTAQTKRKAEDENNNRLVKSPRLDIHTNPQVPKPRVNSALNSASPPSRPSSTQPTPVVAKSPSAGFNKPPTPITSDATTTAANNTAAAAAPKKGSYREILARAEAAKAAQANVGRLKHKAAEPVTKRERLQLEAQAKEKAKEESRKAKPIATNSAPATRKNALDQQVATKKERKPVDLGYKGTMRPKSAQASTNKDTALASTNRGSGRPGNNKKPFPKRPPDRQTSTSRYRWRDSDEEEDDNEEEDGYDEESEGSDDMEGGGFDELEAEEEASLRAAKKEDLIAQREEDAHRRKKMERKRALEELAKKRAQR